MLDSVRIKIDYVVEKFLFLIFIDILIICVVLKGLGIIRLVKINDFEILIIEFEKMRFFF